MNSIYTEEKDGFTINIYPDDFPQEITDFQDDNLFFTFYHRDFTVESKHITKEELINHFFHDDPQDDYFIFPLSALIHSGVHLYIGKEDHPADPGGWDCSFAGAVLASKKEFKTRKEAYEAGLSHIKMMNDMLSGNVYGYVISYAGVELDSCWGFIGDYEYCLKEALALIPHYQQSMKEVPL